MTGVADTIGRTVDEEAVAAIGRHEERALREVITKHGPAVFGLVRKLIPDKGVADEVCQDTFLFLWDRPERFDVERGSLRTFLATIAHNKAVDRVRKDVAYRRSVERAADQVPCGMSVDPSDAVDLGSYIRAALKALVPEQRQAIFMAYFGGFSYREVALELGVPEGTIKTRIRQGLIGLKATLG